ncbi:MAG TPA: DUF2188 domain-containing protein [Candidatus Tripitaka californicus]|uniref:DUF2188 domain-containing protein n=1 Tax=Candidatus Tripitaka californicus TaxID=3367616 RepID=UPI004025D2C2
MPYSVEKRGKKWAVVTEGTGKTHGMHSSKAEAEAQMRALYANVPDARKKHRTLPPRK